MYEIKIYENFNNELVSYWSEFEKNINVPFFQNLNWLRNYYDSFIINKKNISLKIGVIFKNEEVIMIIPMQKIYKYKVMFLEWFGNEVVDFMYPIVSSNFLVNLQDFKYIWSLFLKKVGKYDFIYLKKQPEFINIIDNPFVFFLKRTYKNSFFTIVNKNQGWDEYYSLIFSSKQKYNIENSIKKIINLGEFKFVQCNTDNEKIETIKTIIKYKKELEHQKKKNNTINFEELENFYLNLLILEKKNLINYRLHICVLKLNNNIIAGSISIINKNDYYYLIPSYINLNKLSKYSLGTILLKNIIKWCFENKISIFNFGDGAEFYKKKWSNKINYTYNYIEYNSIKGLIFYFLLKTKNFFR